MKKLSLLLLFICIILTIPACGSGLNHVNQQSMDEYATTSSSTGISARSAESVVVDLAEFCSDISGIYVDLETATENSFEFMDASNGTIYFGAFPGGYGRPGTITNVVSLGNNSYKITLHYPEEWYEGSFEHEKEETHTVLIDSNSFQFEESETIWTYIGMLPAGTGSFDDILSLVQQRIGAPSQAEKFNGASVAEDISGKELISLHSDGWETEEYVESFGNMVVLRWHNTYTYSCSSSAYTDAQMQVISDYLLQCGIDSSQRCYDDGIDSISVQTRQKDNDGNIVYERTTSIQYVTSSPNEPLIREW